MKQTIDAVYENGVFRPLHRGAIVVPDGQHVQITVDDADVPEAMRLAARVYEGLTDQEIDEIEKIALDRQPMFRNRSVE